MIKNSEEKKKAFWDVKETECFLAILKELQVTTLMDRKKFRTSEIFKKIEEIFNDKGYNRTHTQLLEKFKAMKKRFKATKEVLSVSGAGTEDKEKCPFFEELSEIFGHRPIVNQSGVDSTILPPDPNDETSGYCASDAEVSVVTSKDCGGSQTEKFMDHISGRSSLPLSTSTRQRSSSDALSPFLPSSPTFNCLSENSNATSTSSFDSREFDDSDRLCASSSKKPKICKTPTYPRREGSRSGLKSIMQNFAEQIIESQENLLAKTIEEQRKLDKEMINEYNHVFLQQTQMLLRGLQNLSSPLPTNYPSFHQFPGVSTMPPMNPMFTEAPLYEPCPIQPMLPRQKDKNTAHPYTSPWHETQAHTKPETEKAIPKITTISPPNSIQPKTIPYQPLVQNPATSCHTSTILQNETLSRPVLDEDENSSDIEYQHVEYLDNAQND